MLRRQLLTAGTALAIAPMLATRAAAQTDPSGKEAILRMGAYSKLLSALALERATNPLIEEFASLEISEQDALAAAFGMADAVPDVTPLQSDGLANFQSLDKSAFEANYIEEQLLGHTSLKPLMEDYAATGEDPQAKGAAMLAVPAIDSHVVLLTRIKGGMS